MPVLKIGSVEDFVQGGLIDNLDVEIRNARFEEWDMDGRLENPGIFLRCDFHEIMADGSVNDLSAGEGTWSIGNRDGLAVSEDGNFVDAEREGASFKKGSNFFYWVESCQKHGWMPTTGGAHDFNGMKVHISRIPQPDRPGLQIETRSGNKPTMLICGAIIELPGKKAPKGGAKPLAKAGAGAGAGAAKATPAAAATVDNEAAKTAITEAVQALLEEDKVQVGMEFSKLRGAVNTYLIKAKTDKSIRDSVVAAFANTDTINEVLTETLSWKIKDGVVVED